MGLAVASYDEALQDGASDSDVWRSLKDELTARPQLYVSILWYWALPVIRGDDAFPISAVMAQLWEQLGEKLAAGGSSGA
jgi:hypothetical protein